MAQYNLIHTGSIQSNTTSGTGTVSLSNEELMALYDENTTSSGISLGLSDVLYLDIDMGYRIRIDDIKLYIDVPGDRSIALTNVDFYYKNTESDSYTICTKDYDSTTFYITGTPDLFAPRYLRIIVDNQVADIYELEILNDDTQVSFGEDGNESLVILNQTLDDYDELGIFNNSPIGSQTVNAYVMVDYQGLDSDYYIKLSDSPDGTYYGLEDGLDLKNNDRSNKYFWDMGYFDNTLLGNTGGVVNYNAEVGYYTTPVIDIEDKLLNTFLTTETTIYSGTNITWDESFPGGTLKLRSSQSYPVPFNKLFWIYREAVTNRGYIYVGDMDTGASSNQYHNIWTDASTLPKKIKFDRWRGKIYVMYMNSSNQYRIRRYDYVNKTNEDYTPYSNLNNLYYWDLDSNGRVWGYVKQSGFRVVQYSYDLDTRTTIKEDSESDFLGGLSANKSYASCWYTNKKQNKLEHVNYSGETIASISVESPSVVASIPSGGCFVVSDTQHAILQYSYYGTLNRTIPFDSSLTINYLKFGVHQEEAQPFEIQRLWMVVDSSRVLQIDFDGNLISDTDISDISDIEPFPGGCLVFCNSAEKTYQLNNEGQISYIWDFSSFSDGGWTPYPASIYYEEYLNMTEISNILPIPIDPVWGVDTGWKEVPMNGEKLPFYQYHQLSFKLCPYSFPLSIVNLDAEYGDMTGWFEDDDNGVGYVMDVATAAKRSGTYGFRGNVYDNHIRQRIDLEAIGVDSNDILNGQIICEFSAWLRVSATGDSNLTNNIQIICVNVEENDIYTATSSSNTSTTWIQRVLRLVVIPNTRYIDIKMYHNNSNFTYKTYFDDLSFSIIKSPSLDKIVIPKPVVINDIKPQEFKNIYIKTDIPSDADYKEYETRLKCWWGNEEE